MSLIYQDGFAHGNALRYASGAPTSYALNVSPRASGCYYCLGAAAVIKRSFTAAAEVFSGIGFKASALGAGRYLLSFYGDAGVTQHISVVLNASGLIEVRRGNNAGTLLATGTTVIPANSWQYLEVHATILAAGGVVQVRLNGSTSNEINFTGQTKNAGTNSTCDAISFSGSSASDNFSDWYILNTSGAANNTWLGDVGVRTLVPVADGTYSQLTGSDGDSIANWQQVDELPPSGADYNGSATSGNKDSYALTDLPSGITAVYAVTVSAVMGKSDAGAASGKILTRTGATDYAPNTYTLGTSFAEVSELNELNPNTSAAWTASDVNALEVGMQVA